MDPRPRGVRAHQPRHAAPVPAPRPRALVEVLRLAGLRRHRRVPPLPRCLRRPRRPGGAPAAPDLCAPRRRPDVRAGVRHRRRTRGRGPAAHGAADRRGHRRHLAARTDRARPLGAAVHLHVRGERRPGAPVGRGRGGRPAHRPRARGRADPRVRALAAGRGDGRADHPAAAGRGRARAGRPGGGLPRRVPARGTASARASAPQRPAGRAVRDQRARARHRHLRARRRAAGRLPGHSRRAVAAGRARRPRSRRRPRGVRGARRPPGHLPRQPPRGPARGTGRGVRLRPGQPLRARAPPVCRRGGVAPDTGGTLLVRGRGARPPSTPSPPPACSGSDPAGGTGPTAAAPATSPTSGRREAGRCGWSRTSRDGCSAPSTPRPPTEPPTRVRCTSTRARPGWSWSSTSTSTSRWWCATTRTTRRRRARSPTSRSRASTGTRPGATPG